MSEKRTFEHKNVTNNNIRNRKGENTMNKTTFRKEDEIIEAGTFHKREGEKQMNDIIFVHKQAGAKKIVVTVLTTMLIAMMLTGCSNPFRKDDKHATVSVTTSDGQAHVFQSVNGSNTTVSGKELALRTGKINFNLKTGETAHIVFKCDACGNEQEFDINQPWADVISCDCPEKINKDGNAREYSAIEVTYNQEETTK